MKLKHISLALLMGVGLFTSCADKLDLVNPNSQSSATFGSDVSLLEETVIAAYNHTRMEGSYARVGYTLDVCRGDEAWNASQVWYLPYDNLNAPATDEIGSWVWREWYYTINVCNYTLSLCDDDDSALSETMRRIKGQMLFMRGLAYYNLAGYFQNPTIITDYEQYSSLDGLYGVNNTYDEVWDQAEADLKEAIDLLPSRDEGGEWAKGRATCGSAAGIYARVLMMRHKYSEALTVLKDIINQKYGTYKLMANYGDNFREGSQYENNDESLYEVQFLDYGTQGVDDEWTPVNTSSNATQGHAVESNYAPGVNGGWGDISACPWLYQLFKAERTTKGKLDPRLYWTIGTYETDWESFEYGNVAYGTAIGPSDKYGTSLRYEEDGVTIKGSVGLPIAKYTNLRTGLYNTVVTGLKCGINLRIMRYSDVLLRAAECENEVNGPTQQAIDWINQVRNRVELPSLKLADYAGNADKLFEQIANVERPKEFGCEFGRGFDLIRWGFFYDANRLQQLKEHDVYTIDELRDPKDPVSYSEVATDATVKSSYDYYVQGHEFFPIYQGLMDDNPNLEGNSANNSTSNASYHTGNGWTIHPVVDLSK